MTTTVSYHTMRLYAQLGSWRAVGEKIGISGSLAWRVAHGRTDNAAARAYFGLPCDPVNVLPCAVCGAVHQHKTCTAASKRPPTDRMAARLTPEEGKRAREWLERQGFESVTDFWKMISVYDAQIK
jgi:hypothetical protein